MKPARLGDAVVSMKNGMYKPASEYGEDGVPCLRMYNIEAGAIVWRDIKRMRVSAAELEDYGLREGDLLVNRVNSRELVGKTACIPASLEPSVFESKNIRVRLDSSKALPRFISYQLLAGGRRHFEGNAQQVVGMASISQGQIADFPIVLTDIDEQREIVAEIEKQFSRLDEAVAGLQRVKANLKRYKAAILKAAVEGCLVPTEADLARREGRNYETGAQLLQRILETRRNHWQGKGKYKEPAAPDTRALPELPEGWVWATVSQLVGHLTDGDHQPPPQTTFGIPFLVIGNVRNGEIDFTDTRFVGEEYYASLDTSRRPQQGDLLYTLVGSYGITVPVKTSQRFCIQRHMAILRPHEQSPMAYLALAMSSDFVFRQATAVATGTAQMTVPLAGLRNIAIPLPPLAEQNRIVAEVDRLLSIAREAETEVNNNLERAKQLRDAVLQKAFTPATSQQASAQIVEFKVPGKPDNRKRHFTRAVLSAEIVHRLHGEPTFGRVKHQKIFHLCEYLARIEAVEGHYHRKAAGPLDNKLIYANEKELKDQKWYETVERDGGNDGHGHSYRPLSKAGGHQKYLNGFGQEQLAIIDSLIELMRNWKTERCEIFSTAFAAWNDLVIWGKPATDEAILHEILHRWNDSKRRIDESRWRKAIGWMRREGFVPSGFGKPTRISGAAPPTPTFDKGN